MELAAPESRTVYMGLSNTLMGVATFFPVLGGLLIGAIGYLPMFALTAAFALAGMLMTFGLPEPRAK